MERAWVASEGDQAAAEADQTSSDSDQTSAERDEALSEADQLTSNRDQAVADREHSGTEQSDDEYELSRAERMAGTLARTVSSEEREGTAADRLRQAGQRDASAHDRDRIADSRDQDATERDRVAEQLESELGLSRTWAAEARANALRIRARAAADRRRAAGDREQAASDRAKAAEERTLASAELRIAQAQTRETVSQLVGGVAHNFNNLLSVVLLYAHELVPLARADGTREDLEQIIIAADRGTEITSQLLAFAGLGREGPVSLQPSSAIREIEPTLLRLLSAGIGLDLQLDPDEPQVLMDRAEFDHIIVNLVLNARDAMREGGTVTITSSGTVLTREQGAERGVDPGGYVDVSITDTGGGIPAHLQKRIFEPFFTTKGGASTGLGLATVHGVAEKVGGSVDVPSTGAAGTTFRVTLPVIAATPAP